MNARLLILSAALAAPGLAQPSSPAPEPPVPVSSAPALPAPPAAPPAESQRLYGPASSLVAPEAAQAILDQFRVAYPSPRIVIYVNRALVDAASGLKLTRRTEQDETTRATVKSDLEAPPAGAAAQTQINVAVNGPAGGAPAAATGKGTVASETTKTSGENTYVLQGGTPPTVADQQTVREVERLFGRVFRNGGARLADQATATALLGDAPGRLTGTSDQAAKDRAVLAGIADLAIEVLITSRSLTVAGLAGDQTYAVPDIQATAIRLKDAAIVGQASAADILGKDAQAGRIVRNFEVREITEATALALAEDMLTGAK